MSINVDEIVAIDVHVHAEVSERDPVDEERKKYEEAAKKYFKEKVSKRPTIPETADYYRERKMAAVIFTVDGEHARGQKRMSNEEVLEVVKFDVEDLEWEPRDDVGMEELLLAVADGASYTDAARAAGHELPGWEGTARIAGDVLDRL